jgi:hypothetical protein
MATTAKPNTTKSSAPKASAATKATSAPAAPAGGAAVRKTLTDAGYIAVGLGVLGIQQVSSRRQ